MTPLPKQKTIPPWQRHPSCHRTPTKFHPLTKFFIFHFSFLILSSLSLPATPVLLRNATLDTSEKPAARGNAPLPATKLSNQQLATSNSPAVWIVQWQTRITEDHRARLDAAGAEILGYLPVNAFCVRATADAIDAITAWDDIRWTGPFEPAYKTAPEINPAAATQPVRVQLFPGAAGHDSFTLHATPDDIATLATQPAVAWLEPAAPFQLFCNYARPLMNIPYAWDTLGLRGNGETIAIADTGLDTGDTATLRADFTNRLHAAIIRNSRNAWSDTSGHGTKVAGAALGNGSASYMNQYAGAAPEALLVFQSVANGNTDLSGIDPIDDLYQEAYNHGARIFNGSWGISSATGEYSYYSYVTDAMLWSYPDFLICLAAGNDGADYDRDGIVDATSIAIPATAKNALTIGAAETIRPGSTSYNAVKFPVAPLGTDNAMQPYDGLHQGMAAFSSRGPCADGRAKPDIVTPASYLTLPVAKGGTAYSGGDGTSYAAPFAAGAAALVRQWLRTQRATPYPSGALVKALLLNGARTLAPGQYGEGQYMEIPWTRPNSVEGWGHLDLQTSLAGAANRPVIFHDIKKANGLRTTGLHSYPVPGNAPGTIIHAMLVYMDYPALPPAALALVNDLDLYVIAPDGQRLLPFGGADRLNNVERVSFEVRLPGTYHIIVHGYNVPYGPQPYALAIRAETTAFQPFAINAAFATNEFFALSFPSQANIPYEIQAMDTLWYPHLWPVIHQLPAMTRDEPNRQLLLPMPNQKMFYRVRRGL